MSATGGENSLLEAPQAANATSTPLSDPFFRNLLVRSACANLSWHCQYNSGMHTHYDGRVLHRRIADDGACLERHSQSLARTLRVPDDSDGIVSRLPVRLS